MGAAAKFHPQERGFQEFFGFLGGAHPYFPERGAAPIFRGTEKVDEKEYLTDAFAREAVAFIDRHQQAPFFLYLAFNAVHTPMHATDARLKKFSSIADERRRTYAAMTSAMDDAVGLVLGKLRDAGLAENTLVFFFSDNGGPTMRTTTINGSRNTPLRGSKRTTLEGGVRVPFVVSWPGKLPAGKVYDRTLIQLDVQPTALAAAGIEVQPEWKLDGVNLLPICKEKRAPRPTTRSIGVSASKRHCVMAIGNWFAMTPWPTTARRAPSRRCGSTISPTILARRAIWPARSPIVFRK